MEPFSYDRILVPTDMSEFADLTIRYAAAIQQQLGSKVTLLYADETFFPVDVLEIPLGYYLENSPETKARIEQRLRDYAEQHLPGIPCETVVAQDAPARAIVHAARDLNASLVVMGTHGRTGWRRALLGSVAESVLHDIDRPLITVTPAMLSPEKIRPIRTILCPVNFTYIARESLHHARAMAEAFSADLVVVYVAEGVDAPQIPEVETAFSHWVAPMMHGHVQYRLSVVDDGNPAERVLETAQEVEADLLVIGAQHKFFSDATVIGTTTQRITRFARCPVMTVVRRANVEVLAEEEQERLTVV
ncbi:MAG: universal stress protein [Thermoanaerobaculia bacterium]